MRIVLTRYETGDQGTFGNIEAPGFTCHSLELPYRGNAPNISCIPEGEYPCRWFDSPSRGACLLLEDVPGRYGILVHAGNRAGDRALGYFSDSEGCILPGLKRGALGGQLAVLSSRDALRTLLRAVGRDPFPFVIQSTGL